jgi:nucleotide-binding universal stress UspA family protein
MELHISPDRLPDNGPGPQRDAVYGGRESSWIQKIVVAADGSPASVQGLERVADLAPRIGASVIVVYVRQVPVTSLIGPTFDAGLNEALDEQEAEVRQEVLRLVEGTGLSWKFVIRVGSPGDEVVKVADESGADLIVVGSNRHSSLHNLLLGSTAAHLATHSRVLVLVVRSKEAQLPVDLRVVPMEVNRS